MKQQSNDRLLHFPEINQSQRQLVDPSSIIAFSEPLTIKLQMK